MTSKKNVALIGVSCTILFLAGCISGPGRNNTGYSVKEIMRDYPYGGYKEKYSALPYHEKVEICTLGCLYVRPPLWGLSDIFANEDCCVAEVVMDEIEYYVRKKDAFMAEVMTSIWLAILRNNNECYTIDNFRKILLLLYTDPKMFELPVCHVQYTIEEEPWADSLIKEAGNSGTD